MEDRVYTENEFKKAKGLDRLHIAMVEPSWQEYLSDTQFHYLQSLKNVFAIMSENTYNVIQIIAEKEDVSLVKAGKMRRDSQDLFADVMKQNLEMEKIYFKERMYKSLKKAEETGNQGAAAKFGKIIGDMLNKQKPDEVGNIIEQLQLPDLIIMDNPQLLDPEYVPKLSDFEEAKVVGDGEEE